MFTTWEEWLDAGDIPLKLAAPLLVCGPHFKDCELAQAGICAVQNRGMGVLESWKDLQGCGLCQGIEKARAVDRLNKLMVADPLTLAKGNTTLLKIVAWAQSKKSVPLPQGLLAALPGADKELLQFIKDILCFLQIPEAERIHAVANNILTYGEAKMLSGLDAEEFGQSIFLGMLKPYDDAPINELQKTTYLLQNVIGLACHITGARKHGTMQEKAKRFLLHGMGTESEVYMAVSPILQNYIALPFKEAVQREISIHIFAKYIALKGASALSFSSSPRPAPTQEFAEELPATDRKSALVQPAVADVTVATPTPSENRPTPLNVPASLWAGKTPGAAFEALLAHGCGLEVIAYIIMKKMPAPSKTDVGRLFYKEEIDKGIVHENTTYRKRVDDLIAACNIYYLLTFDG